MADSGTSCRTKTSLPVTLWPSLRILAQHGARHLSISRPTGSRARTCWVFPGPVLFTRGLACVWGTVLGGTVEVEPLQPSACQEELCPFICGSGDPLCTAVGGSSAALEQVMNWIPGISCWDRTGSIWCERALWWRTEVTPLFFVKFCNAICSLTATL